MAFKAIHYLFPGNLQKMFKDKEVGKYDLRRKDDLQQPFVRTTQKVCAFQSAGLHCGMNLRKR